LSRADGGGQVTLNESSRLPADARCAEDADVFALACRHLKPSPAAALHPNER